MLTLPFEHLRRKSASADEVRTAFHAANPDARVLPVPVFDIARWLGVAVHPVHRSEEQPDWSGALDTTVHPPRIWVRDRDHVHHKRFSVAHEVGHLMLHDHGILYRDVTFYRSGAAGGMEREANAFAADLLMPADLLFEHVSQFGTAVALLATIFRVSTQAMRVRLESQRYFG